MISTKPTTAFALALFLLLPSFAAGQQRPLLTEDPETIGSGRILLEVGVEADADLFFPVSGLEGNLLGMPLIGASFGISSIAELQFDGGYRRLGIDARRDAPLAHLVNVTGNTTSDIEGSVIATKIRIVPEGVSRPAVGVRFATKLPTASNANGIGLDTSDFFATVLMAKTVRSVRTVGNLGLGILGDPTRGDRQNDVITYGFSMARAISNAAELVGEVNGRINTRGGEAPPGTDSRAMLRLGTRYTISGWRADASVLFGMTPNDPVIGGAIGFTYVFNGFKVP